MQATDKKAIRKKMLILMNQDDNWIENESLAEEIQSLGKLLATSPQTASPLPRYHRKWDSLRRSDFLFLTCQGYASSDIAFYYSSFPERLSRWRKNQGFYGLSQEEILRDFSEEIEKINKIKKLSDYDI